jgi:NADH-quinone oxidoreductase subunit K
MMVPYGHVLILSGILFFMGAVCTMARRNLIMILIGVEIMLNAAGIAFVVASLRWGAMAGQGFVLFIMAAAASEVAVGLALIIYLRRRTGSVNADEYSMLKG